MGKGGAQAPSPEPAVSEYTRCVPTPSSLLERIRAGLDRPASYQDLLRLLRIPKEQRVAFRRQVKALVAGGELIETRSGTYGLPELMNLAPGRVVVHPRGFAFVELEHRLENVAGDVYVAGDHLNEAVHGDRVLVRIDRAGARPEGRIGRVLERGSTTVVGRFDRADDGLQFVKPFDRRLIMDIAVPRGEAREARPGELVTVEVVRWPTPTRGAIGRVVEVLGPADAPGVDTRLIIRKHGIPEGHGDDATAQARRLGGAVIRKDLAGRTDFRPVPTFTIDGEHARDFDDAITIERLANGHIWLGVHIADVAHYVPEGSALDREALDRGTSVYFPERAVHMFPAELATGLCSLNPHVDRLVQSCLMEVDERGEVVRYEIHDGVIHSDARMTYTDVNAILTDRDPVLRDRYADLVPAFDLMHELFGILSARRRRRGSIDFDLPQPEILLDADGVVENIIAAERNVAHRLIEEFMLLANETVARHLDERGAPTLFRVHEPPDAVKVAEFEEFIAGLGLALGTAPGQARPADFQRLVDRIRGTPAEKPIAMLMLRTMQKARYDPANLGHFGLAAHCYTHFTSPIRRYPDLVVHRALRDLRHRRLTDEQRAERAGTLPDLARHTSDRERRAEEAERELVQWKKVRFMADKIGDEFDGYVTGVAPFGLFVELVDHFVEGLVHMSSMADDFYRFIERAHQLRGENTHKAYRLGDRVRVQVVRVDDEQRQVDLGLCEILDRVRASRRRREPDRGHAAPKRGERRRVQRPGRRERSARRAAGRRK